MAGDDVSVDYQRAWEAKQGREYFRTYADDLAGVPSAEEEALQSPLEGVGEALAETQPVQDIAEAGKRIGEALSEGGKALGRSIGLDPKAAETVGKAAELVVGTPPPEAGPGEAALMTGVAAIPGVGMIAKLSKGVLKRTAQSSASGLYHIGGSVFHAGRGELIGTRAFAVDIFPQLEQRVAGMASPKDIEAFMEWASGMVNLQADELAVVSSFDKTANQTSMRVTFIAPTYAHGAEVARAYGRGKLFDLESGEEISLVKPYAPKAGKKDESGKADPKAVMALATALAGGAYGYSVSDDENKVTSLLAGAGLGALAPFALPLARAMVRGKLKAEAPGALPPAPPQLLGDIAKRFRADIEKFQRGHITHEMTAEEGARLIASGGLEREWLEHTYPGITANAAQAAASARILHDEALTLQQAAFKFAFSDHSEAAEMDFLQRLGIVGRIVPREMALSTEAGRTLEYTKEVNDQVGQFVKQVRGLMGKLRLGASSRRMAEVLATMKTPEQLIEYARLQTAPGLIDMAQELWIHGLLSQATTHTVNMFSNLVTLGSTIPERALASGLRGKNIPHMESLHMLDGFFSSVGEAWRLAGKSFITDTPLFAGNKVEIRHAITSENFNLALRRFGLSDVELRGGWAKAFDMIGTAARLPGRALLAEDAFFKQLAFRFEMNALSYREAYRTADAEGLTGRAFRARVNELKQEWLADPSKWEAFRRESEDFANMVTFTSELGEYGKALQTLASHPLGRLVLPFTTTPINLVKYAGVRSPFAVLASSVRDDLAKGGAARDLALARIALGSGTMALFAGLTYAGAVTGFGPREKATRDIWKQDGRQSYALNASAMQRLASNEDPSPQSGDTWVSYNRFDPFGMLVGLAADGTDLMMQVEDPAVREEIAVRLGVIAAQVMTSKTYVQGISRWFLALSDPSRYGESVSEGFGRSLVPMLPVAGPLIKNYQRVVDPVARDTQGFFDSVRATVPGMSEGLPPVRNYWGEPYVREGWMVERLFSPFYRTTHTEDPVVERLVNIEFTGEPPSDKIGTIQLSPEQADYLKVRFGSVRIGGRTIYEAQRDILDRYYDRTPEKFRKDKNNLMHHLLRRTERLYELTARQDMIDKFQLGAMFGETILDRVEALTLDPAPEIGVTP